MQQISEAERRRAFGWWLRTGKLASVRGDDGRELKFNPWHDPDTGRFTFAEGGVFYGRGSSGGGGGGSERTGTAKAEKPEQTGGAGDRQTTDADLTPARKRAGVPNEVQPGDLLIVAKQQTVHDANSLDETEFTAFERAADANRWETSDENAAIHEYVRKREQAEARQRIEKLGAADWAQQAKDFGKLYAEEAGWQVAGGAAGKFVIAPAIRRAAPVVERVLRPQAYTRKLAERTPLPQPKAIWVDETVSMKPNARAYNDAAPGARSNPVTRKSQAPALYRTVEGGKKRLVRFDGFRADIPWVMIDRKYNVHWKGAGRQAIRQSAALRENNAIAHWEVPSRSVQKKARKILNHFGVDNIYVTVVPK